MPTSYEIYQTYLRGPTAVIRLFEQSLGNPRPSTMRPTPFIKNCNVIKINLLCKLLMGKVVIVEPCLVIKLTH